MNGYQLTFFTQQDRQHLRQPLAQWLVEEARRQGISGATLLAGSMGFGHDRIIRSSRFFELAEQPVEVTMAVSGEEAGRMLARLKEEGINVFYVKAPIEFGMSGEE
jgi:uncharacterized protein